MKHRTHRLRRALAAVTLGVGALGGIVLGATGTAGAVTTKTVGTLKSPTGTKVSITSGNTKNQKIGTLVLTINRTVKKGTFTAQTVTLTVVDTTTHPGSKAAFTLTNSATKDKPTVVGPGSAATCAFSTAVATATGDKVITCKLSKTAGITTATGLTGAAVFTWKGLRLNSKTGRGKVLVTAKDTQATPVITFKPTTAEAAVYTTAPPTAPKAAILANDTTRPVPPIGEGTTGRTVGSWTLYLTSGAGATRPTTRGVSAGEHLKVTIEPHGGVPHCATTDAVAFDGKPTVSVTAKHTLHTSLAPTKILVSVGALSGNNGCTGFFAPNVVTIVVTSTVHFTTPFGVIVINITTVKYSVAPKTTNGTVTVKAAFYSKSTSKLDTTTAADKTDTALDTVTILATAITSTNAVVSHAYVTVKTKKVVPVRSVDSAIGTIDVVESVAGTVPKGYVCLSLRDSTRTSAPGWKNTTTYTTTTFYTFHFNSSSKPTVKVTGGNAAASTAKFTTTTRTPTIVSFKVTAASSTAKPSKFVVSGLAVNDYSTTATLMPLVTGWYSSTATCASGPASTRDPTDNVAVAFTTGRPLVTQIYGATADATAVAELEHVYGPVHGCPTTLSGHHSVILARDTFYSDALASQYLASFYRTGTLLTHPTSLPTLTKQAIEFEGITTVYVVGGPLAVSTTVAAQVQTIPVFKCGGKNLTTTVTGAERFVHVVRVTGPTEYATAKAIAERVPKTTVGMLKAQDAYATAKNFNDTTGTESKTPSKSGSLTTAIVATGQGFQDAMSASALSYSTHLPILLTTAGSLSSQAKAAIEDLNIQQVVLMGGPLAVSNAVVTQLEAITVTGGALHVSVLRIAGKTFTDTAVQLAKFELGTTNGGIDWDQAKGANVCHAYTFTNMTALFARATLPNDFTDGLAGAVLESCGTTGKTAHLPLLEILNPSSVGTVLTAYLKMAGVGGTGVTSGTTEKIKFPIILGGPLAVAPSTIAAIQTDLQH